MLGQRLIHSSDAIKVYFIFSCLLINMSLHLDIKTAWGMDSSTLKLLVFLKKKFNDLNNCCISFKISITLSFEQISMGIGGDLANVEVDSKKKPIAWAFCQRERETEHERKCLLNFAFRPWCYLIIVAFLEFFGRHLLLILRLFFLLCSSQWHRTAENLITTCCFEFP